MPIVWVVQKQMRYNPEIDGYEQVYTYDGAKEFGEIRYCLDHEDSGLAQQPIILKLKRELIHFKPDDSLILNGEQALLGSAMVVVSLYNQNIVPVLYYEKYSKTYYRKIFKF